MSLDVDQASQAQPDQRRGDRYTGPLHCHRSALRLPDNNAVDRTIWLDNQTLRVIIEAKSPVTAALGMKMKKTLAILISILGISGCYNPSEFDQIKSNFISKKASFEKLRSMIIEDMHSKEVFSVRTSGMEGYREHDGWYINYYKKKISLDVLLNEVGMTKARYDEYLALFKAVGAEGISYFSAPFSRRTYILIGKSGICGSESYTTINISDDGSIPPSDVQESDSEIIPIVDGWYIERYEI